LRWGEKNISFLNEASKILYYRGKHQHVTIRRSEPHYENYIELSEKNVNYSFLTNWTSSDKTFRNKNLIFDEKSYLVNPCIIESKNVKILNNYKIQDSSDRKLIGDEYNYVNNNLIPDNINKNIF